MKMPIALVSTIIASTLNVSAMDSSLASYYALALMSSLKAEKVCTGMARDDRRFVLLESKLGQRPEDDTAMKDELKRAAVDIQSGLAKVGEAEWCSNVWRIFGPDGPGLIQRK